MTHNQKVAGSIPAESTMKIYIKDRYLNQIDIGNMIDIKENLSQIIFSSGSAHWVDYFELNELIEELLVDDELKLY